MIIKKYLANTLNEAQDLAKQELGPDHMVLTSRQVPNKGLFGWLTPSKFEITAAIEESDLRSHNQNKLGKKTEVKNTGSLKSKLLKLREMSTETEESRQKTQSSKAAAGAVYGDPRLRKMAPRPVDPIFNLESPESQGKPQRESSLEALKRVRSHLVEQFKEQTPSNVEPMIAARESLSAKNNSVREDSGFTQSAAQGNDSLSPDALRKIIREEMLQAQKGVSLGAPENSDSDIVGSTRFLIEKGLSRNRAIMIEEKLRRRFGAVDLNKNSEQRSEYLNAMKQELADQIKTTGPITLTRGHPTTVALVGPTGVGKTTTLAKIAAQYSEQLKKRVGLISLDTQKLGAREQIQALASKFSLPVRVVENRSGLAPALQELKSCDLILIDTAGRSQYQEGQMDGLVQMLEAVPGVQTHLVLSATTRDVDMYGAAIQFMRTPLSGIIFTKLDETIAYGMMANLCEKTGVPISYLTIGQRVPGDIKVADPDEISRMILTRHNSAECISLRKMAAS